MATYVPIHGAGDMGWYLHLVERELRSRGHRVVVMDLPVDDHAATLSDYADVVVQAIPTLVAATTPSMINTDRAAATVGVEFGVTAADRTGLFQGSQPSCGRAKG